MPVPPLDALVVKLLEVAHADKIHTNQVKNLVAQLPAAAAEVRGLQAGNGRTGPCSCGLNEEVARLQRHLQTYIDSEPNTKKGTNRKTMGLENQGLTKTVTDQKKEISGYLATIRKQDGQINKLGQDLRDLRDAHSFSEKLRREQTTAVPVTVSRNSDGYSAHPAAPRSMAPASEMSSGHIVAPLQGEPEIPNQHT